MADQSLTYRVDVAADVAGKEKIDGLAKSVDALGKESKQAFDQVAGAQKVAQTATESLEGAFAKLGIRSAAKIEADILAVNQGLIQLAKSGQISGAEFDRAFAAGQAQMARLRAELNGVAGASESVKTHADGMLSLFTKLGLAFSGAVLAREFLTVNVALEGMERTFRAVTGSSEKAAAEMAYVRDVADRLALPITTVGKAYAGLSAATKGTGVEGQQTRAIFEAVANAMSVAGKSADETHNALLALSQMASKGVIQMEELRGQLGEALPGALNAAAAGFGITTAQLIKLTESGTLTAEQLFPALTKGLNDLYAASGAGAQQAETLTQKWERFQNSIADAFKTIGDAGAVKLLKGSLDVLEAGVIASSVGIIALGKDIGVFLAALKNGDIGVHGFSDSVKAAFAEISKEAEDKLLKAAQHNRTLAGGFTQTEKAAFQARQALGQMADAGAQAGESASKTAIAVVRLNNQYTELKEAGDKLTKQANDRAEATKAETDASVLLATSLGIEIEQLRAKEQATQRNAEALRQLAVERAADLTQAERHLAGLKAEIATRGPATAAEQKQLDALRDLIKEKRNEADAAAGHAQSAAIAAAAATTEAAAYADNSQRIGELAAAYKNAQAAVADLQAQKAAGVDVTVQLQSAEIEAGKASALYRDALNDQTTAIERNAHVKQSLLDVEQASVRLAIEQQRTILAVARVRGDERGVTAAVLEMKRLEIKLAELVAQAKKAEADAILLGVQSRRQELQESGQLTAAKEAELKALEAGAKVKQIEAQIAAETAKRLSELADATAKFGNNSNTASGQAHQMTEDIQGLGNAANKTAGELGRLNQVSSTPSSPTRLEGSISGEIDRRGQGFSGGINLRDSSKELTVDQLRAANYTNAEIQNYFSDRKTSESDKATGGVTRNVTTQTINYEDVARAMGLTGKAVKDFVAAFADLLPEEMAAMQKKLQSLPILSIEGSLAEFAGAFDRARQRAKDAATQAAARDAKTQAPATTHRVEITLAGKTTAIDTASPNAAQSLIDVLKDLQKRAA